MEDELQISTTPDFTDEIDSCCSTPYVSAPSSPSRDTPLGGFYYSAPSSPMHFILSTTNFNSHPTSSSADTAFEFDLPSTSAASADELFLNGQIRPMKLSTHLQSPQLLDPLIESDYETQTFTRGRDLELRSGSLRRRTRSMSPLRNTATTPFESNIDNDTAPDNTHPNSFEENENGSNETTPCASRSSSAGRSSSSKRWVFLKEFLNRSKSEGRNNERHKFCGSLNKDKKLLQPLTTNSKVQEQITSSSEGMKKRVVKKNGGGKRSSPSPHEKHYTAKRAQAEEMRKRTFLPYRQGLFGCLGFSSKSYGAMNGFTRALNSVSSS